VKSLSEGMTNKNETLNFGKEIKGEPCKEKISAKCYENKTK
jgi:hypothetical protein